MKTIKVMLIDDHTLVRDGIRELLEDQAKIEVIAESASGKDALKKIKLLRPDVCVVDISLPDMNGLDLLPLIHEASAETKTVILSMHKKDAYVYKALRAGAMGYVLKTANPRDLITAILNASESTFFLSQEINAKIIDFFLASGQNKTKANPDKEASGLTERERQILCLMLEGNTSNQMADILFVSPKTVEKHRANIYKKSNTHDPFSLMKYAIKNELIDPEIWS
ncbi:MAG: response regulator transcription factor [Proteobacteria bacterium]|nr:response regulator transcription factor [Pseudomonadota bacterium]MBU1715249.1 response regulator transcription factor [Pseudomonadota bacterium]